MYDKIDKQLYTPMMQQYLTIKEQYPDTIVFFRLGDFYELFFNDALSAHQVLEIALTERSAGSNNDKVPMCGVPFHAVSSYIDKLSQAGYKVAIVEQMEAPNNKKIVDREVVRIITPGTALSEDYLSAKDNNYLGAIHRHDEIYHFAYIDLSTGACFLTKLGHHPENIYSEIAKLNIREVIVTPNINKTIVNYFNNVLGVLVTPSNEKKIDQYLVGLLDELDLNDQTLAKILLNYLVNTQKAMLVHLKPFKYYQPNTYLKLDINAVRNLELTESLRGNRLKKNLFSLLDVCKTAMGSRFLKKNILYPLTNLTLINERLDTVEELLKHYQLSERLREHLSFVYDLERIIGRISLATLNPKDLIQLKRSIGVLPKIKSLLLKTNIRSFVRIAEDIDTFSELYDLLDRAINEEAGLSLRNGNVINNGFHQELDEIRLFSQGHQNYVTQLELKERERTGIKSLKVNFNKVFGYYIEVTKPNLPLVKDEYGYIRKQTTSNAERFITEELKEKETLILRSDERIKELESAILSDIRDICKEHVKTIQLTSEVISWLDMAQSLAIVSKNNNYVRPEFSYYDELEIIEGRHPVIEVSEDINRHFIPNDTKMYNNDLILLITGPNMSGKSTYMRQVALIAIMAQMGSYVPAKAAKLPLFDQIFTRIGSSDDIAAGQSTFMTEMLEVNYTLQNATERSLIIFDEVGRGTATFDGMALAQSIIEYLHERVKAKTLFSTHYHELTILDQTLPFVHNVHVDASSEDDKIIFLHKVIPGAADQSYGINVASLAKIPKEITYRAKDILGKLEKNTSYEKELLSPENYNPPIFVTQTLKEAETLILKTIKSIDPNDMTPLDALVQLIKLKELSEQNE